MEQHHQENLQRQQQKEHRRIQSISKLDTHRICSGQVILSLATAVKELLENALDAGATNVEVRLKEYGSEMIEVSDNGSGVKPEDYQALTLKYHTSKLQQFTDLTDLGTFGFRGEALSSLCALAELSVVTRTEAQDVGAKLEFDHSGQLVQQVPCPRSVGTTVAVKDLFKGLPVRHRDFMRNCKTELSRLVSVLQAYAMVSPQVRIVATHQAGKAARTTLVCTPGGATTSLRAAMVCVLGARTSDAVVPLEVPLPATPALPDGGRISGFVSKAHTSKAGGGSDLTRHQQFIFLNGRPVDLPRMNKALNDAYRSLSSALHGSARPIAVLDVQLPRSMVDVNVVPDKRTVMMQCEQEVVNALEQALQALWEPSRRTFALNSVATPAPRPTTQTTLKSFSAFPVAGAPITGRARGGTGAADLAGMAMGGARDPSTDAADAAEGKGTYKGKSASGFGSAAGGGDGASSRATSAQKAKLAGLAPTQPAGAAVSGKARLLLGKQHGGLGASGRGLRQQQQAEDGEEGEGLGQSGDGVDAVMCGGPGEQLEGGLAACDVDGVGQQVLAVGGMDKCEAGGGADRFELGSFGSQGLQAGGEKRWRVDAEAMGVADGEGDEEEGDIGCGGSLELDTGTQLPHAAHSQQQWLSAMQVSNRCGATQLFVQQLAQTPPVPSPAQQWEVPPPSSSSSSLGPQPQSQPPQQQQEPSVAQQPHSQLPQQWEVPPSSSSSSSLGPQPQSLPPQEPSVAQQPHSQLPQQQLVQAEGLTSPPVPDRKAHRHLPSKMKAWLIGGKAAAKAAPSPSPRKPSCPPHSPPTNATDTGDAGPHSPTDLNDTTTNACPHFELHPPVAAKYDPLTQTGGDGDGAENGSAEQQESGGKGCEGENVSSPLHRKRQRRHSALQASPGQQQGQLEQQQGQQEEEDENKEGEVMVVDDGKGDAEGKHGAQGRDSGGLQGAMQQEQLHQHTQRVSVHCDLGHLWGVTRARVAALAAARQRTDVKEGVVSREGSQGGVSGGSCDGPELAGSLHGAGPDARLCEVERKSSDRLGVVSNQEEGQESGMGAEIDKLPGHGEGCLAAGSAEASQQGGQNLITGGAREREQEQKQGPQHEDGKAEEGEHQEARDTQERSRKRQRPVYRSASLQAASALQPQGAEAEEAAAHELERSFDKADFRALHVIGQFNLGFILARLDQDIFIIDQHAADEKFNFERLQSSLTLNKQPLIYPRPLNMSVLDEMFIRDHLDTFRRSGFDFVEVPIKGDVSAGVVSAKQPEERQQGITEQQQQQQKEQAEVTEGDGGAIGTTHMPEAADRLPSKEATEDSGGAISTTLMLSAVPAVKGVTLGPADVAEAMGQLVQSDGRAASGGMIRPARVRAVLASRACRFSIMIGTPLDQRRMRKILDNLAGLVAPWNCPHGRPTMRHVCVIPKVHSCR